jgi:hypothetical protein
VIRRALCFARDLAVCSALILGLPYLILCL